MSKKTVCVCVYLCVYVCVSDTPPGLYGFYLWEWRDLINILSRLKILYNYLLDLPPPSTSQKKKKNEYNYLSVFRISRINVFCLRGFGFFRGGRWFVEDIYIKNLLLIPWHGNRG